MSALKGAKEPDAIPSLSASVILIAPLQERTLDGYDYRVLLLKRHTKSSTFVSAHVFPGGHVDPIDSSNVWDPLYPDEKDARIRHLKLCAARECFEECGILLEESNGGKGKEIWAGVSEEDRRMWRDKVHGNGHSFFDLFEYLSASGTTSKPSLSKLQYRANWITPRMNSRRFDTHFFVSVLPPTFVPATTSNAPLISDHLASADAKETVSADWLTPAEAIRRTLSHTKKLQALLGDAKLSSPPTGDSDDSIILFPPQFYLLAELADHKSYATLLDDTDPTRIRPRAVRAFEPQLKGVKTDHGDVWPATVLPGDPEHTATSALLEALGLSDMRKERRHRTFIVMPPRVPGKKLPPGFTVVGMCETQHPYQFVARIDYKYALSGCRRKGMADVLGPGWEDMTQGDVGQGPAAAKL
ncbi:hypothetical protein P7C70_g2819, partial [Phenoliferia sp. Uapishka_3]